MSINFDPPNQVSGFLLINKPSGPTSHDIVDALRKITNIKRIGHAGTLDPFASGLLIVGVGRKATRQLDKFLKLDKTYTATLRLGAVSDTYDRTGTVRQLTTNNLQLTTQKITETLKSFAGEIEQVPPMYSAKKVKGKKLYELARQGIEIERKPVTVKISKLQIINYNYPDLTLECSVSSGTYIRSLAHDIGQALGCGAYLEELERTQIGPYKLEDAVELNQLNKDDWQEHLTDLAK